VVGAGQQDRPAAVDPGGDRMAGVRHHRVFKVAEHHDSRDADLAEPAEPGWVRLFEVPDLEPGRDRAPHHGLDRLVRPGRCPGPQSQAEQAVAVFRRDQRAALTVERVVGGPRIIVDSGGDERQGPDAVRVVDSEPERGPAAPAVPDEDGLLNV
jgi:hypothetical protein